jgi:hypothetical protein
VNESPYLYTLEKCQVEDKRALQTFRDKRVQWLRWLNDDEHHSISISIASLVWNDVSFRWLVRAAELNGNGALANSLLAEKLIDGHFAVQTLSIRRLMDSTKGTISLVNLLKDLVSNADLFTRENYVAYDGLPYDDVAAKERVLNSLERLKANRPIWAPRRGPDAWDSARYAHEMFDLLSGVASNKRQRQDKIPKKRFEILQRWLEESDASDIVQWTHTFLAHAADKHRRAPYDLSAIQPTLDKITKISCAFARVSEALLAHLLLDSGQGEVMPIAHYEKFECLDKPAIAPADQAELAKHWDITVSERNRFLKDVLEELLR